MSAAMATRDAATTASSMPAALSSRADLARVRCEIQSLLEAHDPYPGVAVDRCWDVWLSNRAARRLVAGIPEEVRGTPTNVFRAALHPDGFAPLTSNFDVWSAYLLGQLHYLANRDSLAAELAREIETWPGLPPARSGLISIVPRSGSRSLGGRSTSTTSLCVCTR